MTRKLFVFLLSFILMIPKTLTTYAEEFLVTEETDESSEITQETEEVFYSEETISDEEVSAEPTEVKGEIPSGQMADNEKDIRTITVGETVTVDIDTAGKIIYYQFIPEITDEYVFKSIGTIDTCCYLYDAEFNQLTYNDDGDKDSQFMLRYKMEAGTTYYFGARLYSSSSTGSFDATLSVYEPIQLTDMYFSADQYTIRTSDSWFYPDYLIKTPSNADNELTVISSNEEVASVRGKTLDGVAAGTATITVTADNGLSASTELLVGNYASDISAKGDTDIYLPIGKTKQLEYELEPTGLDLSDEKITWSVLHDSGIASVDENGVVTANRLGETAILATIKNGGSAYYNIHVVAELKSLSFINNVNYLRNGSSDIIWNYLNISPDKAKYYPLTITSSDESVISVSSNYITGQKNGTATVTVTADNGLSASATFNIGYYAESFASSYHYYYPKVGSEFQIQYKLNPQYPENGNFSDEEVVWSVTDDPSGCISLDESGKVTTLKVGSAMVRATIKNGKYISFLICVSPNPERICFTQLDYYLGIGGSRDASNDLCVTPYTSEFPYKTDGYNFSFTSSNSDVATVTSGGIIGKAKGTAVITATSEHGLITKTRYHVGNYATYITRKSNYMEELGIGETRQLEFNAYGNDNCSDDVFTWEISESTGDCIHLSDTGLVTAVAPGYAKVTVSSITGYSEWYHIYVYEAPTELRFDADEYNTIVDKDQIIEVISTPETGYRAGIKWESSNPSVARVSSQNDNHVIVNALEEGTAIIRATSVLDENVYAECTINGYIPVDPTSITVSSNVTTYVGYENSISVKMLPEKANQYFYAESNNENVIVESSGENTLRIKGQKAGTSVITITSENKRVSAKVNVTVIDETPVLTGSWTVKHVNPSNKTFYTIGEENDTEYVLLAGETYNFDTITDSGTNYAYHYETFHNDLIKSGLFEDVIDSSSYGYSGKMFYSPYAKAAKAGTVQIEMVTGHPVKITVIDSAYLGAKVTADSSMPAEIVNAYNEYDFGLYHDIAYYAAELDGLEKLSVNADQKAVVQSWLEVSLDEYEKDDFGNIRFVFTATPKARAVSMAKTADNASEGTVLIPEQPLNAYGVLNLIVPTDQIFGNTVFRSLKVTQKTEESEIEYADGDLLNDDGTLIIHSENGSGQFTIIGKVSSYKNPVYTWTETADGYEVTAVAESDEGEPTITETVKAVYSVEKEAECMTDGIGVYTATFTNAVFRTQTKKVAIPSIGHHEYGTPEYTWSRDNKTAIARAVCTVCGDEVTETVNTSYEVIEEPTLEEPGAGRYTAVFTNELFETQTKEVEIPSLSDKSAKDIILDQNEATVIYNGTLKLNATVLPEDCEDKSVKWSSGDTSIATVDSNGNVKAVGIGKVIITAETVNGLTDTCEVRVLFTDVALRSQYFFTPVYWAVDNGITVGAGGPGKFSPTASCTREQFVTFLWRLNGEPEPTTTSSFSDVKTSDWYYKPITWAAEEGITVGLNDGTGRFGVGQACTREQCVTFLHRSAGSPEPEGTIEFTDSKEGRYYYKAIKWAAGKGITVGLNDGTGRFGVGQKCTRGMLVTFLYRSAN